VPLPGCKCTVSLLARWFAASRAAALLPYAAWVASAAALNARIWRRNR
jgi:tryptophan-rich sensory protein